MKKYISLLIFLFFIPNFIYAESFPTFPMAFWGTVNMPANTVIRAYYGSVLAGALTTQEPGIYGYTEPTKQKLVIGEGLGPINFTFQTISGIETSGCSNVSYTGFTSGLTIEKNLYFYTSGCGGAGGGGGGGDASIPIITLNGGNITINQGSTYIDAGASALDLADGNITANIVTVNPVNTNIVGTYIISYNVSDAAGNSAVTATRTVNVVAIISGGGGGGGGGYSYYTINASAGANGSINSPGSSSMAYGSSKTYTIFPNAGYKVGDVLVDNVSKGSITTYTFSTINANHAISATFSAVSVTTIVTKVGDANGDGKVNKYDFSLMMASWNKTGSNVCDFNNDGKVDKYDFSLLMLKWGL